MINILEFTACSGFLHELSFNRENVFFGVGCFSLLNYKHTLRWICQDPYTTTVDKYILVSKY